MPSSKLENSKLSITALVLGAWAVVSVFAFLANRGSDVGQLGKLFENLGGGPLVGSGAFDSLAGVAFALAIAGAWLGIGQFAVSFVPATKNKDHSHILELAVKMAVGAAIWSLVWFFLGIAGAYSVWTAIAASIIGLAFLPFSFRRAKEAKAESRTPEKTAALDKFVLAAIAFPVVLSFIASIAPPTAKDTLLYHFAVPEAFIAQGSNAFIEGNIASYLALGTEMHTVWAMLAGGVLDPRVGEAAAGATVGMFFPILLAATFGWAREIGISRRWALVAVLMVASVPSAYHVASSAYIDLALAVYVTLAVYSLARWWRSLGNGWLVLIAIFLGAALSAKLTTLVVFGAFGLVVLLRARKAKESEPDRSVKIIPAGFAALILAVLIASPWYLRTWQQTDSPVFPFYLSIWPAEAPGWDVERSNLFQAMNSQYGRVTETAADHLLAAWNVSIEAQPEVARYFDGVLGVTFLIGLPLLLFALWKFDLPVDVKIGAGMAAVVFLFWLFSSMQLRYLLPILPVLAIGIAAAVDRMAGGVRSVMQYSLVAAGIAGLLVTAAWFGQRAPLRVVFGGESRADYLSRNLDYYQYYAWLNSESPGDARVWLINMRRDTYHLDRPVFADYLFEDWTLRRMVWGARSTEELKAGAAALGVRYILTRHDFLFDYDRSTLVDEKKPRSENEARLKIAKDLVLDPARTIRSDDKFSLVKVF